MAHVHTHTSRLSHKTCIKRLGSRISTSTCDVDLISIFATKPSMKCIPMLT